MKHLLPRGIPGLWRALKWSAQGLRAAWLTEASFRLEVCAFAVLGPVGLWLGDGPIEKIILVGSVLLVIAVELLNSAVETVVERYGNEFHPLAGRAKDLGSAAVFVLTCHAAFAWGTILYSQYVTA